MIAIVGKSNNFPQFLYINFFYFDTRIIKNNFQQQLS